jgi:hypothetical protein
VGVTDTATGALANTIATTGSHVPGQGLLLEGSAGGGGGTAHPIAVDGFGNVQVVDAAAEGSVATLASTVSGGKVATTEATLDATVSGGKVATTEATLESDLGGYTATSGTSVPADGTLVVTGPGVLGGGFAWNNTGSTAYLCAFDATTQPATGTPPLAINQSIDNGVGNLSVVIPAEGVKFNNGLYLAWSAPGSGYVPVSSAAGAYTIYHR